MCIGSPASNLITPTGFAYDSNKGNVYVTSFITTNGYISKITSCGIVTSLWYSYIDRPSAIVVDSNSNLFYLVIWNKIYN